MPYLTVKFKSSHGTSPHTTRYFQRYKYFKGHHKAIRRDLIYEYQIIIKY